MKPLKQQFGKTNLSCAWIQKEQTKHKLAFVLERHPRERCQSHRTKSPVCVLVVTLLIHETLSTLTTKIQQKEKSVFRFLTLPSRDLSISLHPFILGQARTASEHSWEGKSQLWGHEFSLVGEYWWLLQEMKVMESRGDPSPHTSVLQAVFKAPSTSWEQGWLCFPLVPGCVAGTDLARGKCQFLCPMFRISLFSAENGAASCLGWLQSKIRYLKALVMVITLVPCVDSQEAAGRKCKYFLGSSCVRGSF